MPKGDKQLKFYPAIRRDLQPIFFFSKEREIIDSNRRQKQLRGMEIMIEVAAVAGTLESGLQRKSCRGLIK